MVMVLKNNSLNRKCRLMKVRYMEVSETYSEYLPISEVDFGMIERGRHVDSTYL